MRTFVKMILPVAAFMLASAGAVGTKLANETASRGSALMTGYVHNPSSSNCLSVEVNCQETATTALCKAFTPEKQVYRINDQNQCVDVLWKITP